MRFFSLIIVALLGATNLFAQSRKEIKELKIKAVTETTVLYKDGKESSSYKSQYKTFDKEGNTLTDTEYNPDGSVRRKETSKYKGKDKIEEIVENGTKQGSSDDDNDGPKKYKKTTWKYNEKGDKIEEVEYDAAGTVTKKTTITYNSKGDRLIETEFDGASRIAKKTVYGYDSKGLRTEKKIFGSGGETLVKHVKYTYSY
jgi:hypothetical protein